MCKGGQPTGCVEVHRGCVEVLLRRGTGGAHLQESFDHTRPPQADGVGKGPQLVGLGAIHGGGAEQLDHLGPR